MVHLSGFFKQGHSFYFLLGVCVLLGVLSLSMSEETDHSVLELKEAAGVLTHLPPAPAVVGIQ